MALICPFNRTPINQRFNLTTMHFEKIHNKGQAQLFKNPFLESLTKTHPLVIWSMYMPVIIGMLYYTTVVSELPAFRIFFQFITGMFCWSLFEYVAHRFAFHHLAKSDRARKIVYIIHGNHHEYPRDKQRLFMPALPSILLATFLFSVVYLIAVSVGNATWVFAFFPGFLLGYLIYGTMHYAIHAWNPPFKWMKPLWRNHHLHHYKEQERGFGVSSTLWDHVFGTMFDLKREKEDKEKVKELMFENNKKGQRDS